MTTFALIHGASDSGWYRHLVEKELAVMLDGQDVSRRTPRLILEPGALRRSRRPEPGGERVSESELG